MIEFTQLQGAAESLLNLLKAEQAYLRRSSTRTMKLPKYRGRQVVGHMRQSEGLLIKR